MPRAHPQEFCQDAVCIARQGELAYANALRYAVTARSPAGTIVRSDMDAKFRSCAFATTLRAAGLHLSMGRVASAADDAPMEFFFTLLRNNILNCRRGDSRE